MRRSRVRGDIAQTAESGGGSARFARFRRDLAWPTRRLCARRGWAGELVPKSHELRETAAEERSLRDVGTIWPGPLNPAAVDNRNASG
jgi:hypothetical protein